MSAERVAAAVIAPAADSIVVAAGVSKTYELGTARVEALRSVDLSIGRGEMLAVMGPSGCGKTTLLNCLSGLDAITGGSVLIEGNDLGLMSDKERTSYRAHRMGFVFQVYNLLPVLTAVENIELPLLVSGVPARAAREYSLEALERVDLRDWAKHRPAELSGGQRQRVTIARALVNTPAIVWADEPTGALDSATADGILDLMQDLNSRVGVTLVLVTHDHSVGARCRRVIRMRDGEIVGEGLDEPVA